ncbi:MAG: hypothetical protein LBG78_01510 [Azoarcus sp.]|nr:hypothetical protein [Azoarcus sp.]
MLHEKNAVEKVHYLQSRRANESNILREKIDTLIHNYHEILFAPPLKYDEQVTRLTGLRNASAILLLDTSKYIQTLASRNNPEEVSGEWKVFFPLWETWVNSYQQLLVRVDSALAAPSQEAINGFYHYVDNNRFATISLSDNLRTQVNKIMEKDIAAISGWSQKFTHKVLIAILLLFFTVPLSIVPLFYLIFSRNILSTKLKTENFLKNSENTLYQPNDEPLSVLDYSFHSLIEKINKINHSFETLLKEMVQISIDQKNLSAFRTTITSQAIQYDGLPILLKEVDDLYKNISTTENDTLNMFYKVQVLMYEVGTEFQQILSQLQSGQISLTTRIEPSQRKLNQLSKLIDKLTNMLKTNPARKICHFES